MLRPGPRERTCERSSRVVVVGISFPCILLAMSIQGGLAIVYSSFRERAQPAGKYMYHAHTFLSRSRTY